MMNGLVLALTTVFLRGVGLFFNVYITNKIGAEGMGLFGLIMSVYMLANTVATSGAYLAATRLVTEELSAGCPSGARKAIGVCLGYGLFFGVLSVVLLIFFAPQIGRLWLKDIRSVRPLCCLAVSLPFVAVSCSLNGFFAAKRQVIKSASAQVLEMLAKALFTIYLISKTAGLGTEAACVSVALGSSLAELCSCLFLMVLYVRERRHLPGKGGGGGRYLSRLFAFAAPIALSSYVRSGLVTWEHILIPSGLSRYGASAADALAQYGIVHGMVMPLLLFPASVLGAFSGLLVPELTEFQTKGSGRQICRVTGRALKKTLLFAIGTAGVFLCFGYELGEKLYHSGDAGFFICVMAPLVVVMYVDGVVDSMLKGLGQQVYSMSYNIIDSAVSVGLMYLLLPRFGADGYVMVLFIAELLNCGLSFNRLIRVTGCRLPLGRTFFLPCAVMALVIAFVRLCSGALSGTLLWVRILWCGGLYLLLMYALGEFRRD